MQKADEIKISFKTSRAAYQHALLSQAETLALPPGVAPAATSQDTRLHKLHSI